MDDQILGLDLRAEDVLNEEWIPFYREKMNTFHKRLEILNINIYHLEQVIPFPIDLLADGYTADGYFFDFIVMPSRFLCNDMQISLR